MSQMQPGQPDQTTQQQKEQGNETFLSPEERAQLQRMLGHPTDYPKELKAWVRGMLEVDPPDIPISNFKGKGVPKYVDRKAASAMTAVTGTGEQTIYSYNLKAKTLSPTGQMRIMFFFSAKTPDSSNSVTIRFKLGSTTVISYSLGHDTDGSGELDSTLRLGAFEVQLVNAGAYNSQLATLMLFGLRGAAAARKGEVGSSTVALDQDQTLSITAQWSSGDSNDQVSPQYIAVEVFNPVGA